MSQIYIKIKNMKYSWNIRVKGEMIISESCLCVKFSQNLACLYYAHGAATMFHAEEALFFTQRRKAAKAEFYGRGERKITASIKI